jgi:hypothetical protein
MFLAFSKIWLINIALAVFVVLFGIMSFDVWSKGDETIPEIRTGKGTEKPLPGKRIIERAMSPESTYGIVADKNLFAPNRLEYIPEKQKPGSPNISEQEKVIFLYGVILVGDRNQALISSPEPESTAGSKSTKDKWVKVGDTIGNFSVTEIKKDRIILTQGANTREILLYDKNKPARKIIVAEKSAAPAAVSTGPTVVSTGPAAVSTGPAAAAAGTKSGNEPPKPGVAEGKGTAEGGYRIINTPFGPVKRKIE